MSPGGLEIVIPSKANVFVIAFGTAWLGGWSIGESHALRTLFGGGVSRGFDLFLLFWLVGWTLGGGAIAYWILWMAVGKEVVRITHEGLSLTREVLGMGRTREYDVEHVKALRVAPDRTDANMQFFRGLDSSGGLIAFDYGAKTVRFASSIDEAEAARIVDDIVQLAGPRLLESHVESLQRR